MKLFTCGHKTPDSDSIVSAISLAYLQTQLGHQAIAARQGEMNPESEYILQSFDLEAPILKTSYAGENIFITDYNNYSEAPDDLKEANLVGIVDHHKLGGLMTSSPLECWIRPVGCTNTILKEMYDYYQVDIPENIAGAMMSAILSDTVMFKSPTCTPIDKNAVMELAQIAGIDDPIAFGLEMFKVKSAIDGVPARELILRDFKNFDMYGHKVGVGQLETVDLSVFDALKADLIQDLETLRDEEGYDTTILLLTDIMQMGSQVLVATKSPEKVEAAWNVKLENNQFWLDGCLSRKKQVIPFLEPTFKN
jgi:manganese-dependent inorganic pyrophosphatase